MVRLRQQISKWKIEARRRLVANTGGPSSSEANELFRRLAEDNPLMTIVFIFGGVGTTPCGEALYRRSGRFAAPKNEIVSGLRATWFGRHSIDRGARQWPKVSATVLSAVFRPPICANKLTIASTPVRWRSAENTKGRPFLIRVASRSITSSDAPTWGRGRFC